MSEVGPDELVRTGTRLVVGATVTGLERLQQLLDAIARPTTSEVPEPDADEAGTTAAPSAPAVPDQVGPPVTDDRVRHIVLGAVFEAQDAAMAAAGAAARVVGRTAPSVRWVWGGPLLAPVRRRVDQRLDGLAQRGAEEDARARAQVGTAAGMVLDGAVDGIIGSPRTSEVVERVVDQLLPPMLDVVLPPIFDQLGDEPELLVPLVQAVVGQVLDPILQTAIPEVLGQLEQDPAAIVALVDRLVGEIIDPVLQQALPKAIAYLNEDPEVVRSLVRDQGMGFADEVAGTVRVRARSADRAVDDVLRRVLRRRTAEALEAAVPPPAIGPGEGPP